MDCVVCCEQFNKTLHFKVECKGCEEKVCRKCCQTFIIEHSHQQPSCMFCKTPWERDFMNHNLTKKFVNTSLKNHQENVYLEQQISMLPETQQDAKKEKKIREIVKELEKASTILNQIKKSYNDQMELIKAYNLGIYRLRSGQETTESSVNNFTHKCKNEDCNGFLNNRFSCELCETRFCGKCLEVKEEGHECNEELLATVQAIRKEAKPCPTCGEMISKIDGCDQMWCVKCHVQFSWRTGTKIEGYNHNPEYFRWLRETGQQIERNPVERRGVVVCGNEFNDRNLMKIIRNFSPRDDTILTKCLAIYRYYIHNEHYTRREDHQTIADNQLKKLRVQYLLNEINKDVWKESIQKIYKNLNKKNSYSNIKNLVSNGLRSIIERMFQYKNENNILNKYNDLLKEAESFRNYINASFIRICNTYGSTTCPGISDTWREVPNLKFTLKRNS